MLRWWKVVVEAMTGGGGGKGRCQRRRKGMAGGRGTTETKKSDVDADNNECPNSNTEITEKPSTFPDITKQPPTSTVELDFYSQARKALSFRPPFDLEDSQASPASVSGANTLPSGLTHLLSRHADSRKRHKKSHSGSEKKSSTPGLPRGGNIWIETEDYFRELTVEDIERLDQVSGVGFNGHEKCFLVPCLDNNDDIRVHYGEINRMLASACENNSLNTGNSVEINSNRKVEVEEMLVKEENEPNSMDVDSDEGEMNESLIKEEKNGEKKENAEKNFTSFIGVEWLLGSRNKIYLASERPSKKRKLLGRDAGLEKLLVARPVAGLDSICHYCSYGDMGDPLNSLIKCCSCEMVIHQRCYGVREEVDSSWLCSWCKHKNFVGLSLERPCLLCPKQGGALKPVQKRGFRSQDEGSEVEFAHLFCCQWMPEVYLENTRIMEPIMNFDELKDTRRKLICNVCKVKCGACVRCSNGACRTSFHPICAREASHRMEIWGKIGCDEVELRAFCSKHSEVQHDSSSQNGGDNSSAGDSASHVSKHQQMMSTVNESRKLKIRQTVGDKFSVHSETADMDLSKLNEIVFDREKLLGNRQNSNSQLVDEEVTDRNDDEDVPACGGLNFTLILKKLIDLGKVDAKDVASEIGVSPDSLNTILTDNHTAPELQRKLTKWLKSHAHIGSLQKTLKLKIKSSVAAKAEADVADCASDVSVEESDIPDAVPVKSVPPRRRTKGNIRIVKDDKSCISKDEATERDADISPLGGEDSSGPSREFSDATKRMLIDPMQHQDNAASNSLRIEDELSRDLTQCHSENGLAGETKQSEQMTTHSFMLTNEEFMANSYVHPFIYNKLMQIKSGVLAKTASYESVGLSDREASQLEASSSSGLCCTNHSLRGTSGDWSSKCNGESLDQLVRSRSLDVLKLSPEDEVEGELIYYQHKLLCNTVTRKRMSDDVMMKIVRSLPQEIDAAGKRKWDAVLVSQYNHELRETKKQGRKERRHKEAQAVLAAATAAAAASSRISSFRKDALEESAHQEDLLKMNVSDVRPGIYSQLNPRVRETTSMAALARTSLDTDSDFLPLSSDVSKEHLRTCDICRRTETILNPILVCSSCKVAVHLDCYRSVKSSTGPWHCELCEELFSSQGSGAMATSSWEKPYMIAECGLCGGTAGAFRKSVDGQWIHALCAEWVLESTYRRGQTNHIQGMETVCKGVDGCIVCRHKQGVCLKCSYGHCQSTFHPTCARSAGFYMTARTNSGKLQHKAYCEKHSLEQRAKADTQKHGIEEFKSLKQVRVELERLRLLCERIIKREKLKRELVICSHDILASSRDSVLSALARHPFYRPEVSSESATTSIQGYTDGCKSGSEIVQRSDDITVDSTVAGKRHAKISISMDNNQKTVDSSASQSPYILKPAERVSFSGKQIPQRLSVATRNLSDNVERPSKYNKHTETFEKELIMTSDQASMKNQRLPKGFVYVPIQSLSKDKETVPDACSHEPVEHNG